MEKTELYELSVTELGFELAYESMFKLMVLYKLGFETLSKVDEISNTVNNIINNKKFKSWTESFNKDKKNTLFNEIFNFYKDNDTKPFELEKYAKELIVNINKIKDFQNKEKEERVNEALLKEFVVIKDRLDAARKAQKEVELKFKGLKEFNELSEPDKMSFINMALADNMLYNFKKNNFDPNIDNLNNLEQLFMNSDKIPPMLKYAMLTGNKDLTKNPMILMNILSK